MTPLAKSSFGTCEGRHFERTIQVSSHLPRPKGSEVVLVGAKNAEVRMQLQFAMSPAHLQASKSCWHSCRGSRRPQEDRWYGGFPAGVWAVLGQRQLEAKGEVHAVQTGDLLYWVLMSAESCWAEMQ